MLPNAGLRQLPGDDPVFTTDFGGYDLRTVEIRDPQPLVNNQPLAARVAAPRRNWKESNSPAAGRCSSRRLI